MECPIRILSLPCQPRYNSSSIHLLLGQPVGDRFCTIYTLLLVALAKFFYIDIFSNHYSGFVVFNSFLKAVGEALHILFYISFSEFAGTSTRSNISYLVSLCLVSVALFSFLQVQPMFYFIDIFSTSLQDENKGGSLPRQLLLFTLFLCWNVHSSSFCTGGAVAISISCSQD